MFVTKKYKFKLLAIYKIIINNNFINKNECKKSLFTINESIKKYNS